MPPTAPLVAADIVFLDNTRCNDRLSGEMNSTPNELATSTSAACVASTVYALRAAAAHVERSLSRALEPFGLTAAQFELLVVIDRLSGSGAGCSELGRHLAAPGPDVTRMLDRLDSAALVSRNRDEKDRRVVHTALTEKGRQLLADVAPHVAQAEGAMFEGLADEERRHLTALLQGIKKKCPSR
jgi:DNA-binding MarR family transcriptional regulator